LIASRIPFLGDKSHRSKEVSPFGPAVAIKLRAANSWNGRLEEHLPRMGALLRIHAPVRQETGSGRLIDGEAPMEPPIGYGLTHRSIFPESHLERYRVGFQAVALMGLYENWVLPRLLDLAMRNQILDNYRQRTIEAAREVVLEVGVRSGLNLPLYGPAVTRVVAVDPSPELLRLASKRTADMVVPVALIRASAEHLPFPGAVFDTVMMTWTLCSIPNPIAALAEMRRVLKPGGRLLFVEHGLSPEIRTARWQHWLTPYWKRISGGCHLDRKTDDLIRAAGFQVILSKPVT
jgi:SAM-dependent methyltransferase